MGRTTEQCLKGHKRALTSGNTAQSAIAEHAVDQMHEINWKEAEVVDYHRTTTRGVYWKPGTSVQNTRQWTVTSAPYHQSTTPWFANWDQLESDQINVTACFWHIVCLHVMTLLLLFYYHYYHYYYQFPPFMCIKMPASFATLSFLTDEDLGLGWNLWIKWPWHRPVILAEFQIIIMQQPNHTETFWMAIVDTKTTGTLSCNSIKLKFC